MAKQKCDTESTEAHKLTCSVWSQGESLDDSQVTVANRMLKTVFVAENNLS